MTITKPHARHILVVDDNRDAADLTATFLEMGGHTVDVAYDAAEAERRALARTPQVAFIDLSMPGMGGLELVRRLKRLPALETTHFIALTGAPEAEAIEAARTAGFDAFLEKPAFTQELEAALPAA